MSVTIDPRKALGAFYTRQDAAHYLASWALRDRRDVILEPSAGDGTFIAAANDVAESREWEPPRVLASEISSAAAADLVLRSLIPSDLLHNGDFLTGPARPADAVIGNPPYVRLRALATDQATAALAVTRAAMGQPMSASGSVWMAFVCRAIQHLKPTGRLALVLPWDFTYVRYARQLWGHLGQSFDSLRVVRIRERIFADLGQDVLLLFADGYGGRTSTVQFQAHRTVEHLNAQTPEVSATIEIGRIVAGRRAFQEALLPAGVLDVLRQAERFTVPVRDLVTFNIGYVCGDKSFFHPSDPALLPAGSLRPALNNSRRLRGKGLRTQHLPASAQAVLWLPGETLTHAETAYERTGRTAGVHRRYKCQVREPWYRVPGVQVPDLVMSVFAHRPTLLINDGQHVASNSFLCGYLKPGRREDGDAETFAAGWYSTLTLLNAELEVHSLGGGVLVLVPNEAGNIRVPGPGIVPKSALAAVDAALRRGDFDAAYQAGDAAISERIGREGLELLRAGVRALERWRSP